MEIALFCSPSSKKKVAWKDKSADFGYIYNEDDSGSEVYFADLLEESNNEDSYNLTPSRVQWLVDPIVHTTNHQHHSTFPS